MYSFILSRKKEIQRTNTPKVTYYYGPLPLSPGTPTSLIFARMSILFRVFQATPDVNRVRRRLRVNQRRDLYLRTDRIRSFQLASAGPQKQLAKRTIVILNGHVEGSQPVFALRIHFRAFVQDQRG